jgi:hypothetical protein
MPPKVNDQDAAYAALPAIPDDTAQKAFLRALSVTGDVLAAAQAAGYPDDVAFFDLRLCNIGFTAEWDAALHVAYMRLESALVSGALKAALNPAAQTDVRTMAMWHRLALNLLAAHRRANGPSKKHGHPGHGIKTKQDLIAKLTQMRARTEEIARNEAMKANAVQTQLQP